jgi:signal transduction histidine kinase
MNAEAVAAIKSEGPEKAYAEINNPSGKFVDRDLYIVVYGLDGMVFAHGANKSRIGTNQIDDKDVDGKAFVDIFIFFAAFPFSSPGSCCSADW